MTLFENKLKKSVDRIKVSSYYMHLDSDDRVD